MRYTKSLMVLLAVVLAALSLGHLNARPAQAADDTIIIGITDKIDSLDNADGYAVADWEVLKNTGEGLLHYQPGTTKIVPGLATDMPKISADGKTYTLTLRDGLKFADGTPLDAKVYVAGLNRVPALKGQVAGLYTSYVSKAEAPDAKTIVFTLSDSYGFFPALLAGAPCYFPVNPKIYSADKLNQFPTTLDGIGPYKITAFKQGEQWVYEANANYYGDKPKTNRIIVRFYGKPEQLSAAVEKGEVDVAWRYLGSVEVARMKKADKDLTIYNVPGGGIRYVSFDNTIKPYDNANIRAGVAASVDRQEINDRVYNGLVNELYSMVPPDYPYATQSFKDLYGVTNLDMAKKFFTAAGATTDKPLQLQLWYPPEHYGTTTADWVQLIKTQVEKTGLAKVELKSQEWATYIKAATTGKQYGMFVLGWFPDFVDPDNFLSPFAASDQDPDNGTNYSNKTMDDLLHRAAASPDPKVRTDLYKQAQDLYAKDAVTVPLFIAGEYTIARPGISGADKIGATIEFDYSTLSKGAATTTTATQAATAASK